MFLKQKAWHLAGVGNVHAFVTTPCARVGKNEIFKLGMRGGECAEGVYCERKDLFEPFFEGVSVLVFELCVVCCLEESVWLKKGWMWWLFVGCV